MGDRYQLSDLLSFVAALFRSQGLGPEPARVVARGFIEADLMGFTTHGLAKVPNNLGWLRQGCHQIGGGAGNTCSASSHRQLGCPSVARSLGNAPCGDSRDEAGQVSGEFYPVGQKVPACGLPGVDPG